MINSFLDKGTAQIPFRFKRLLSYRVANLQGLGSRARQEDSFAFVNALDVTDIKEKGMLAVVADGMGGMQNGQWASQAVIHQLRTDFERMDRGQNMAIQLCDSVYAANRIVFQNLHGEGGSTVIACLFFDEKMYYVSVGDSYLFLKRGDDLLRVNREHNCKMEAFKETIRQGSVDPSEGFSHPEKDALMQYMGKEELDDIDWLKRPLPLQNGDIIMLCSDGVGGVLNEEIICDCFKQPTAEQIAAAIDRAVIARNRQYQDNYTALIIQCGY